MIKGLPPAIRPAARATHFPAVGVSFRPEMFMGTQLGTIEVFPFPAVDGRTVGGEIVAQLTFSTTGNPKEAATCNCLNKRIPCSPQSHGTHACYLLAKGLYKQATHTHTSITPPSAPQHRHTSHHAPVCRSDENPIRGLHPVMHADLITIKIAIITIKA